MLNIALAKGRISKQVMEFLISKGIDFPEYTKDSRKLIFVDSTNSFQVTLVKSPDVPIYVERGSADVGIVGKDILAEDEYDIYELNDLGLGKCRMAVAGIKGRELPTDRRLIVGTKYPHIATAYYQNLDSSVDIIKLNGSVELAPIVGLADVIVDIVESGNTLKENGLSVITYFMDLSARLVVNKGAFRFKQTELNEFMTLIEGV